MKTPFLITLLTLSACYSLNPLIDLGWINQNSLPPLVAPGLVCEDTLFLYCQKDKFNSYLNISTDIDWRNYTAMEQAINQFVLPDLTPGIFTLCQARARFHSCLGAQYDACMNPFTLIQRNLDLNSAYQYVALFKSLEFDCNGGNIQATKNWPCLYSVYTDPRYAAARNECVSNYLSAVGNGTNYCTAGQNLLPCMARIFDQFPCASNADGSKIMDIRWFECERYRVSFQIEGGCPSMTCSQIIFGSAGFYVDPGHSAYMHQHILSIISININFVMAWFKKFRWSLMSENEKIRKLNNAIEKAKYELDDVEKCIESRKVQIVKAFKEAREAIPDVLPIEEGLAVDLKEKLENEIEELKFARRSILDRIFSMEKLKMEYRERATNEAINNCGEIIAKIKRQREDPNEVMTKLKQDSSLHQPFTSRKSRQG